MGRTEMRNKLLSSASHCYFRFSGAHKLHSVWCEFLFRLLLVSLLTIVLHGPLQLQLIKLEINISGPVLLDLLNSH